jgi:hypothetical protein
MFTGMGVSMRRLKGAGVNLLQLFFLMILQSCWWNSNSGSGGFTGVVPVFAGFRSSYVALPNDMAPNDSLAAYAHKGIFADLQPNGNYEFRVLLSTDVAEPILRLFVMSNIDFTRIQYHYGDITPQRQGDTLVYSTKIKGEANVRRFSVVLATAQKGAFAHAPKDFKLRGQGDFPAEFGINLIIAGQPTILQTSAEIQALVDSLDGMMKRVYNQNGVQYTGIQVYFAHNHPKEGKFFKSDEPFHLDSATFFSGLLERVSTGWPAQSKSNISIILLQDLFIKDAIGLSPLYGWSLGGGTASVMVFAVSIQGGTLDIYDITNTAAHEAGHFLGLRHTTSPPEELNITRDFSNKHDGLEDTPFCAAMHAYAQATSWDAGLNLNRLAKFHCGTMQATKRYIRNRPLLKGSTNICPDESNLMFFETVPGVEQVELSPMQVNIINRNLTLYPR